MLHNQQSIAIIYASHDGHTETICQTLRQHLSNMGKATQLIPIAEFSVEKISDYACVVFASPIRYGHHLPEIVRFIQQHQLALSAQSEQKSVFISVNLTARKSHRNTPDTCRYLHKFLRKLTWQPDIVEVFAGKLDYSRYGFFDKQMIRFIMWITKGPTNPRATIDYTDWQRVEQLAEKISTITD